MVRKTTVIVSNAAMGATVICFAAAILAQHHWIADLIGQFWLPVSAFAAATAFLFAVYCGYRRRWFETLLMTGVGSVILVFPPPSLRGVVETSPPTSGPTLSILQHNALVRNETPEEIAAQIRREDPDIAVLLEVSTATGDGLDELSDTWPHQIKDPIPPGRRTWMRILSKHPLSDAESFRTQSGLAVITATVETPQGRLNLVAVHLTRPWPFDAPRAQMDQLDELRGILAETPEPYLVLGDFNSAPWGRLAVTLRREDLAMVPLGERGTWPAFLPSRLGIPIDLAFVTPCVKVSAGKVLEAAGSDHRAVAFDLQIACTGRTAP